MPALETGQVTFVHKLLKQVLRFQLIGLLVLLFMMAACTSRGDFGREMVSPTRDSIKQVLGFTAASARNEPISYLQKTSAEQRLYNIGQSIQASPAPNNRVSEVSANMKRWRILPVDNDGSTFDEKDYHDALSLWDWPASPASQYGKLRQSIRADYEEVCYFLASRDEVTRFDKQRQSALDRYDESTPIERYYALERIKENRLIAKRTMKAFRKRAQAYRYALKRLEVRAPSDQAAFIHTMINKLDARLKRQDCHQHGIKFISY